MSDELRDDYTPTTNNVRDSWVMDHGDGYATVEQNMNEAVSAQFNRWLARERAAAWDEGVKAAAEFVGDNGYAIQGFVSARTSALNLAAWLLQNTQAPNPYRAAGTETRETG